MSRNYDLLKLTAPSMQPAARFAYHIKSKYGMTVEQYDKMFEDAEHKCEVCDRPVTKAGMGKGRGDMATGCIDHCHTTNRIRGVLCRTCNSWLGAVGDDASKATRYLERR